jgi:hypothetical protein
MRGILTRREWAAALGATAATAAHAQTAASDDALADARDDVREALERLRKFNLPAATEPAFVFKP